MALILDSEMEKARMGCRRDDNDIRFVAHVYSFIETYKNEFRCDY